MAVLVATSTRYGYHRDELYFIVSGAHPAFGYPDQPSLVPLLCWAMHQLAPGSLLVLRLPSALAAAATTLVAALVAREVGGSRRAQVIAACCTASSGFALGVGHFVTTTTFDMLSTSIVGWLLIRAISQRSGPALLMAGVVTGIGFEAKPQVALVAAVAVISLLAVGPRWPLRSPWLAAGIGAAVLLAAPYVIWQATHGWPQLTVAANIGGSAEGGRAGFVPFQFLLVSPVLAPVWIAGLVTPFRRATQRSLRFVPLTYAILALAYLAGNGKAYYLASLYPVLLGLGAIPTADWTLRIRSSATGGGDGHNRARVAVLTIGIVVSTAIGAFIALPLLPTTALQGSAVMAVNPDQGETVGWPRFVATVADAWNSIPPEERANTVIFTANYGEAGAVDVLGTPQLAARLQRPQRVQRVGPARPECCARVVARLRRTLRRGAGVRRLRHLGHHRRRRRPEQRRTRLACAAVPANCQLGDAVAPVAAIRLGTAARHAHRPTIEPMDAERLVREIDEELRDRGAPGRALHDKTYLKSALLHYGASVPSVRAVAKGIASAHPTLSHDEVIALVTALWAGPVYERRLTVVELLDVYSDRLGPADGPIIEQLLREAGTWALVDGLAIHVVGRLVDRHQELGSMLDRWANDSDFWLRRSALLALLVALRRGHGDFERFSRYADAMLGDTEFFIRKAIGWVLRDTAKKRPDLVYRWLLPRASRASGVTIREAVKPLSTQQREAVLAAR